MIHGILLRKPLTIANMCILFKRWQITITSRLEDLRVTDFIHRRIANVGRTSCLGREDRASLIEADIHMMEAQPALSGNLKQLTAKLAVV